MLKNLDAKDIITAALVIAAMVLILSMASCTSAKRYAMDIQVKCPPETGGSTLQIPEILMT